jgi:hypothetical protein
MTRNLKVGLLLAAMLVVLGTTSSEACHRRRARQVDPCGQQGYTNGSPTGYYSSGQGEYAGGTAAYNNGYSQPAYGYGQPGYDYGRPGYNPGGLGGPASGLGVRPGLGVGGFGPGR